MADKPETLPEWASVPAPDGPGGQSNVVEPPTAKKRSGWSYLEFPVRNWFNWLHNTTYQWLAYFDAERQRTIFIDGPAVAGGDVTYADPHNVSFRIPLKNQRVRITAVDKLTPAHNLNAVGYIWSDVTRNASPFMVATSGSGITVSGTSGDVVSLQYNGSGNTFANVFIVIEQTGTGNAPQGYA